MNRNKGGNIIDYNTIHESAITDKEYLFEVCNSNKAFTVYENVGVPDELEYESKGTGKLKISADSSEEYGIDLLDFYGNTIITMYIDEIKSGYWIINEIPTSNDINEIDLEYGIIASFKHSELWYEPFTDEINGFVLYGLNGYPIATYIKVNR